MRHASFTLPHTYTQFSFSCPSHNDAIDTTCFSHVMYAWTRASSIYIVRINTYLHVHNMQVKVSAELSFHQLREGIKNLKYIPPILITEVKHGHAGVACMPFSAHPCVDSFATSTMFKDTNAHTQLNSQISWSYVCP
jgi:hypothetical protein